MYYLNRLTVMIMTKVVWNKSQIREVDSWGKESLVNISYIQHKALKIVFFLLFFTCRHITCLEKVENNIFSL